MKNILKYTFIVTVIVTLLSCQEEPSDLGSNILPDVDKVKIVTLDNLIDTLPSYSSVFKKITEMYSSAYLMLGKYKDYEAYSVIRILSIPDTITNSEIVQANLILFPYGYAMDNKSDEISISAYRVTSSWTKTTFDSTFDAGFNWDKNPVGSFSGSMNDSTYISIPLDIKMVKDWADTSLSSQNHGILLMPDPSMKTIRSFYSGNSTVNYPALRVIREKSGVRDTLLFMNFENAFYAKKNNPFSSSQYIYAQAGSPYHTRLRFNLSKVPNFAYIGNATLTLTLDKSNSLLGIGVVDSLAAGMVYDSVKNTHSEGVLGKPTTDDPKKYVFDITSFVQGWINNKPNLGMDIYTYGEIQGMDLFSLYSERVSDKTKIPKLTIVYFIAPK